MKIDNVIRELRGAMNLALRRGYDKEQMLDFLRKILKRNNLNYLLLDELTANLQREFDFVRSRTLPASERRIVNKMLTTAGFHFAKTKNGINDDIKRIIDRGFSQQRDAATIRNELEGVFGRYRFRAETVRRTAKSGFSGMNTLRQVQAAGVDYLTFIGPLAERKFCKEHLNKTYHIDEIRKMSNGTDLSVLYYKGGWNCRHNWVKASRAEIEKLHRPTM